VKVLNKHHLENCKLYERMS